MSRRIVRRRLITEDRLPRDLHPVLRRVYLGRNITGPQALDLSLPKLLPLDLLGNLQPAVELLGSAMDRGAPILVIGDYDADGATSTALAVRGLRALGAPWVDYLVPNRFSEGYGLTPALVERAALQRTGLIVTVDNGVGSIAGVARAGELGIPVLVTDHHLPGDRLPAAVVVNPNLSGDPFPSKNLAGVGVIFYVLAGLRRYLRQDGSFKTARLPEPNLAELLDLVALGTVADVVPLDHNNRILVEQGLRRMRARRCTPGILALLRVSGRDPETLTSQDLAFGVAPRLNAAGRLSDMSLGVRCLLSQDSAEAYELAQQLDSLNRERRQIEAEMRDSAEALLGTLRLGDDGLPAGLCLFDPSWHQGVIGILASRLVGRYHRPVIAFAPGTDGEIKGSGRSIQGVHMRDALDAIAKADPTLITRFGGHAMAAGLTVPSRQFERFSLAFESEVSRRLEGIEPDGVIHSDGALDAGEWRLETAIALRQAGPWGQGFPEPLFDGGFRILEQRIVGEGHLKLRVRPADTDLVIDAIAFNRCVSGDAVSSTADRLHLAYHLDVNHFQDSQRLQLIVEHIDAPPPT